MSHVPITAVVPLKSLWIVAALAAMCSLGIGWNLGGRPEIYWSMERERLHALVEYSQEVRIGQPLTEKARLQCQLRQTDVRDFEFSVHMIGYGQDSCCIGDACGSFGQLISSRGGAIVMIQDIETARSFGVRTVVDARGEHLADRLVVVTDIDAAVRGIFRNLDSQNLDAALKYSLTRPPRGHSMLALAVDRLHAWASNVPRRL